MQVLAKLIGWCIQDNMNIFGIPEPSWMRISSTKKSRNTTELKKLLPSRELTYPTLGKGKSSSKCHFLGDMLVPWRVYRVKYWSPNACIVLHYPMLCIPGKMAENPHAKKHKDRKGVWKPLLY